MEKINTIAGTNINAVGGMGKAQFPFAPMETSPQVASLIAYQLAYPEVYYRLQPHIMMACDQMDSYGYAMPTQEVMDQMADGIYNDVIRLYPDMIDYDGATIPTVSIGDPNGFGHGFRDRNSGVGFGRGFGRRGLFRDLIDILLLSELFRRRRRFY